jgi:hypothetical protein
MKTYLVIPLILLTACASKPKSTVVQMPVAITGRGSPAEGIESIRYSENIKAYPVGRYVEPNNNLVMHERHTVYRVETTTKWNLHPNGAVTVPLGPPLAVVDPAKSLAPVNAEVIAEVNRQKTATQALLDQGTKIDQTLSQLSGAFHVTKQIGEQNQQLRNELTTTQQRLDALEQELRKKQADVLFGANQKGKTNEW